MSIRIAINGFGRIGRCVLRALLERPDAGIRVVAINDLAPAETLAHLLRADSVHGRLHETVTIADGMLHVGGHAIRLTSRRDPGELDWDGIDVVYECTGHFTDRDKAAVHLRRGARRVLISAPGKDADRTVVYGVNHDSLRPEDRIVSNASCTTNCLAPVAQVIDAEFGIETGYMTTIHAYTGDQPTHDSPHRDPYRGRAAALSMVPTSTGAARAIALVLPQLEGRLEGSAVRVPVANVSMVDLAVTTRRPASAEAVNAALDAAARGSLAGILGYETAPFVSVDFNHDPHSSTVAAPQTTVTRGGMLRVVSWYDNEWGFANRMNDTACALAALD